MKYRQHVPKTPSQERIYEVIRRPLITEKTTALSETNQVAFEVDPQATKPEIKAAVEKLFSVKVQAVNTLNLKGKRKRRRGRLAQRKDIKKAYVTLVKGQTIDLTTGL